MARNYWMNKKLSDYKWAIGLITFLSVIIIALCCITGGFKNWDTKTWFGNEVECEHVFEDGKCIECELECEHEYKEGKCTICDLPEESKDSE